MFSDVDITNLTAILTSISLVSTTGKANEVYTNTPTIRYRLVEPVDSSHEELQKKFFIEETKKSVKCKDVVVYFHKDEETSTITMIDMDFTF